jgi:hypothetical protein
MTIPLAVSLGANLTLGLWLLAATVGLVVGFFTFRGSGISNHPWDGHGDAAPGAKLPDEFHQFAARQIHDADMREAEIERRVDARMARDEASFATPVGPPARAAADDMTLDEANRRLAAEAAARKGARSRSEDRAETPR